MTLHVLVLDKFTVPFHRHITHELRLKQHQFLFISDTENTLQSQNIDWLKTPLSSNIIYNLKTFVGLCFKADRIVMHGDTLIYLFAMMPFLLRKTAWVIYGQELDDLNQNAGFYQKLKRFVLGKVKYHITHIKGDSDMANAFLNSNAEFIYSPMYLSNVAETNEFHPSNVAEKSKLKIMAGNSMDPSNNHIGIFKRILPFVDQIETVYCPLSYGIYGDYKKKIIQIGRQMFGEKFVAIDKFMPMEEYKKFLADIDVVIFDHYRQEAMGVTLTLLSLGKIVYVNPNTTSYKSLTERGFSIFDNHLIDVDGLRTNRDVDANLEKLQQYYSMEVFNDSWLKLTK